MDMLMDYSWPGNIRELQNIIERAVVLAKGPILSLDPAFLPKPSLANETRHDPPIDTETDQSITENRVQDPQGPFASLEQVQRHHIVAALRRAGGVIDGPKGAARILMLHPNTLRSRMAKLGIDRRSYEIS